MKIEDEISQKDSSENIFYLNNAYQNNTIKYYEDANNNDNLNNKILPKILHSVENLQNNALKSFTANVISENIENYVPKYRTNNETTNSVEGFSNTKKFVFFFKIC